MAGTANSGGRNAKSKSALVLSGTFRPDRHADHDTPDAPKGVPDPPKPLEGDALEEWNRMIVRLTKLGTLSTVDDAILYQYCQLFGETEGIAVAQAETAATAKILQENFDGHEDLTFEDLLAAAQEITKLRKLEAGYISKVRQNRMSLRMLLTDFGLTPSSRNRVKLPAAKPAADPAKDKYFGGSGRRA